MDLVSLETSPENEFVKSRIVEGIPTPDLDVCFTETKYFLKANKNTFGHRGVSAISKVAKRVRTYSHSQLTDGSGLENSAKWHL